MALFIAFLTRAFCKSDQQEWDEPSRKTPFNGQTALRAATTTAAGPKLGALRPPVKAELLA